MNTSACLQQNLIQPYTATLCSFPDCTVVKQKDSMINCWRILPGSAFICYSESAVAAGFTQHLRMNFASHPELTGLEMPDDETDSG